MDLIKLQGIEPIPRWGRRYLMNISIPEEYLDALCREFIRNDFDSGVWLDSVNADLVEDFKRYIELTVAGRFMLSLATYVTKHPNGSTLTDQESVNLRSEYIFRLVDLHSGLPTVNKLLTHLCNMFPVIKLDNGVEILPFVPTRADLEDNYRQAVDLYNGNRSLAALVRNTIAPTPVPSVVVSGYTALCLLSRREDGNSLFVQDYNTYTSLGWPGRWASLDDDYIASFQTDGDLHFKLGFMTPGSVDFNLRTQGKADGSVVVAGKIRTKFTSPLNQLDSGALSINSPTDGPSTNIDGDATRPSGKRRGKR